MWLAIFTTPDKSALLKHYSKQLGFMYTKPCNKHINLANVGKANLCQHSQTFI